MAWAPHQRGRNNAYLKVLREQRKARGICIVCGQERVERFAKCLACRQRRVAYRRATGK